MIGKLLTLWCILASVVTEGGCFVVHRGTYTVSAQRCYWRRGSQLRKEQKSAVREGGCKVYGEPKQQAKQDTNFAQDYSFANLDHIKLAAASASGKWSYMKNLKPLSPTKIMTSSQQNEYQEVTSTLQAGCSTNKPYLVGGKQGAERAESQYSGELAAENTKTHAQADYVLFTITMYAHNETGCGGRAFPPPPPPFPPPQFL
eukprot:CAMPEP_0113673428 /NCGR_PEP_ID=MMETSP0038_2-20120614/6853_1 /TAXON_ID=2898 /ORGANISM="Cryptomonas paramecium" /LENGTH=201 /DNA_ID=CAMNT_0000589887 /DNA_START=209 /DNA_END=811 /DNA_ORIENTATION=- /assembly_acc=CAM_ASM_000170